MNRQAALAATFAAALTAGCVSGATTVTRQDYTAFYSPEVVSYLAGQGEVRAEILGLPFGGSKQGSDEAIVRQLYLPAGHPVTPVTLSPPEAHGKGGRIVLMFDPAFPPPDGDDICALNEKARSYSAPTSKMDVLAAFCFDDSAATQTFVSTPRPTGPNDPSFRYAMSQMMYSLLPTYDPTKRGDGCQGGLFGC